MEMNCPLFGDHDHELLKQLHEMSDMYFYTRCSKPVDHFISEEERGAVVTRSRFFMRPDKAEPYLQKAPSAQTTASSLSSKVMSPTEPSPLDENR